VPGAVTRRCPCPFRTRHVYDPLPSPDRIGIHIFKPPVLPEVSYSAPDDSHRFSISADLASDAVLQLSRYPSKRHAARIP